MPVTGDTGKERKLILYLRKSFSEVDADGDGVICRVDFLAWTSQESVCKRLKEFGVPLDQAALGKAFDMLDLDGDGGLHMDEFVVGVSYLQDRLTIDDRKQRFAIDGILRRQESIRTSASLWSGRILVTLVSAIGLAGIATYTGFLPAWFGTAIPAGASALMLGTSVAESAGSWSKGSARYSAAKALEQAYRGEVVVAEAVVDKAFIPFGVGLTAIAAAACSGLKTVINEQGDFLNQLNQPLITDLLDADDVVLVLLAIAAVVGASITSDQSLRMRTTLRSADQEELFDDRPRRGTSQFWMSRALQPVGKPPEFQERAVNILTTLVVCLLPLPFVEPVMTAPDLTSFVNAVAVVIAEVAAAQAAVTLVLAEKDFANVERRVSMQSKNAALAELFCAQTNAEAAVLPASTALSGAALGSSSLLVEFSRWLAAAAPWPATIAVLRSSFGALLAHLEARAAWLQRGLATASPRFSGNLDVVSSSLRELERVLNEFKEDPLLDNIMFQLRRLPVGMTQEFEGLSREERRKVHLAASDLGMASNSVDRNRGRVVRVTNLGYRGAQSIDSVGRTLEMAGKEVQSLLDEGVPGGSRIIFSVAAVAGLCGSLIPVFAGTLGSGLTTPLITAGLALLTVQQERSGTLSCATALRYSSGMGQLIADANSLLARAYMVHSFHPTALAMATFATTVSIMGFVGPYGTSGLLFYLVVLPAFPVALAAFMISVWRLRRISDFTKRAATLLQAQVPPCAMARRWYWWPLLSAGAFLLPWDVGRKVSIASAVLMGGTAVLMASASVQVARGDNFVARSAQIYACADAWAGEAAKAVSLLPFESDAAVVMALLASTLAEVSVPVAASFPLAGAAICLRAIQLQNAAMESAKEATMASDSLQVLSCNWPWKREEAQHTSSSGLFASLPTMSAWRILLQQFQGVDKPLAQSSEKLEGLLKQGVRRVGGVFEGSRPEKEFGPDAAEMAVQNVQRDLDELGVTQNAREQGMSGTLSLLAGFSVACFLVPVFLYSSAGVILPLAGAGLTLFTASEDSKARECIQDSKIRAAELTSVVSTMEVLISITAPYKARLTAATGLTALCAITALALEHSAAHSLVARSCMGALVVVQALVAGWCVWPVHAVWHWTDRVREAAKSLTGRPLQELGLGKGTPSCGGKSFGTQCIPLKPMRRIWPLLCMMPGMVLALLPHGRSFAQRAVASTAAGAGIVAVSLFVVEKAAAQAERIVATRASTCALTDAFANEGEQQSVLLPLVSAASVALSALITVLVELNPFSAAALTLLQTGAWVLAARKGVTAKYYSRGAMQVDAVTERPTMLGQ